MNTYNLFRSLAFKIDPELIHEISMGSFKSFPRTLAGIFNSQSLKPEHSLSFSGLNWSGPLGLAAGLDKNAVGLSFFSKLAFGAIEVGTVTPRAQAGNPKPRLFRLKEEGSLLNRMGFNNQGMEQVYQNIINTRKIDRPQCLGVNLGKNKTTSSSEAPLDYYKLYVKFVDICDYLVVNVSSPNTPGLRDLQEESALSEIFEALKSIRSEKPKPLFLKVAPDLSFEALEACVSIAKKYSLSGLIATNTTIMPERGQGGISGQLLAQKSKKVRAYLLELLKDSPEISLIGVGGVSSFDDLWDFWKLGGKVMQVYTGFIYQGPKLLNDVYHGIETSLKKTGARNLDELLVNYKKLPDDWRL